MNVKTILGRSTLANSLPSVPFAPLFIVAVFVLVFVLLMTTRTEVWADEVAATTAELIRSAGYLAEVQHFTSGDGYVLQVVRASNPLVNGGRRSAPGRQPVLFIHGILTTSKCFVLKLRPDLRPSDRSHLEPASMSLEDLQTLLGDEAASQSLVFTLLDHGHIVYLLNRRGALGSRPAPSSSHLRKVVGGSTIVRPSDTADQISSTLAPNDSSSGPGPSRAESEQRQQVDLGALDEEFGANVARLVERLRQDRANSSDPSLPQENVFEALLDTIATLPTPSQLASSLALDADVRFWNYSLDTQAEHDITGLVEHALADSPQARRVSIVGHSVGSALPMMALIRHPELANKLTNSVLWAPALDEGHGPASSPIFALLTHFIPLFRAYIGPVPPSTIVPLFQRVAADFCLSRPVRDTFCSLVDQLVFGPNGGQQEALPGYLGALLDSISSHELAQLLQSFRTGRMYHFDYGSEALNRRHYGQAEPPLYREHDIRSTKLTFWSGATDIIVTPDDSEIAVQRLPLPTYYKEINETGFFNHISFLLHDDIARLVVVPSFKMLVTPEIPYNVHANAEKRRKQPTIQRTAE